MWLHLYINLHVFLSPRMCSLSTIPGQIIGELALELVNRRMVEVAQQRQLELRPNTPVKDLRTLKEFFKSKPKSCRSDMYACGIGAFELHPGWVVDSTRNILEELGWVYDPSTMGGGTGKNPGNGLVEKMLSRKQSNQRKALRKLSLAGPANYDLTIIRPEEEQKTEKGTYRRRKPGYKSPDQSCEASNDMVSTRVHCNSPFLSNVKKIASLFSHRRVPRSKTDRRRRKKPMTRTHWERAPM
jgi:hypothetical protein